MKKLLAATLTGMLILGMGITNSFASTTGKNHNLRHVTCAFTDANGDGICDECSFPIGQMGCGRYYTDNNGDGICDNYSSAANPTVNYGANYSDSNGDGVCDNYNPSARHTRANTGHHGRWH